MYKNNRGFTVGQLLIIIGSVVLIGVLIALFIFFTKICLIITAILFVLMMFIAMANA